MKLKLNHLFGYSSMLFKEEFEELKDNIDGNLDVVKMLNSDEEDMIAKQFDIEKYNNIKSQISQIKKILRESLSYTPEQHRERREDIANRIRELFLLHNEYKKLTKIYRDVDFDEKEEMFYLKDYDVVDSDFLTLSTEDDSFTPVVEFSGILD